MYANWGRFKKKYPEVYNWIMKFYDRVVIHKPTVFNAFLKTTGSSKNDAQRVIGWGTFPTLDYYHLMSFFCTPRGIRYALFIQKISTIYVNPALFVLLEKELKSAGKQRRDTWQLITEATILHELVHVELYLNGKSNWEHDGSETDAGLAFERQAYGHVVEADDAEEVRLREVMNCWEKD